MDPIDHVTDSDLEEEIRSLRGLLADAKEEIRQLKEDLRVASERKVEEVSMQSHSHFMGVDMINVMIGRNTQTDEGVPPEEIPHQIRDKAKKEETTVSGPGTAATKHGVKVEIKPKKLVGIEHSGLT